MALTKVTSHFITGTITNDTSGNAATVTNGIYTNESHSNPSWITGLAWSKITGAPAFITGITSSNVTTALGFTPVTNARQITINGTSFDLSADRSWTITSMIYPSAGIPISTGSGWGSSITNNSANWNTAYGWGDHGGAGYLTSYTEADTLASVLGRGSSTTHSITSLNTDGTSLSGLSVGEAFANYAGWNTQLNVHGAPHARIHVKTSTVQMGIYAHNTWHSISGSTVNGHVGTYTNHGLGFLVNADPKMVINTSGQVGINQDSPTTTLHVGGVITATGGTSTNWNTAYGWGNHASAGYLTSHQSLSGYLPLSGGTLSGGLISVSTATPVISVKNTTASAYSEIQVKNDQNHQLIIGSIGSSYSNASWAGSRYIYSTSGQFRIKSANELKFYSGGLGDTGDLALFLDTNRNSMFMNAVLIGGYMGSNAYNAVASTTGLSFGGGNDFANYSIGTTSENFGGNYTKLNIKWHTGIRFFAKNQYGGVRFYSDVGLATKLFSIGEGDAHVRVSNNLYIGGTVHSTVAQNSWGLLTQSSGTGNESGIWFTGTTARLLLRDSSGAIKSSISANGSAADNIINGNAIIHAGNIGSQTVNAAAFGTYLKSQDTRSVASTPQTGSAGNSAVRFDFKSNGTNGLSDGGSYNGVMYFRKYGGSTDWSGGGAHELGFTDSGNLYKRYGTSTSWGSWNKLLDSNNYSSYALPTSGGTVTGIINIQRDIRSAGQLRATGWYNDNATTDYTGLAFEIGISAGQAYAICYNRNTNSYGSMNFNANNFHFNNRIRLSGGDNHIYGGTITSRSGSRAIHMGYSGACIAQWERTDSSSSNIIVAASGNHTYMYSRISGSNSSARPFSFVSGTSTAFNVSTSRYVTFYGGYGSDRILKKNIEDHSYGLDAVNNLKPRKFNWREHTLPQEKQVGFIAQELEEVIPEAVYGYDGAKAIMPSAIVSVLTKAIQELSQQVTDLKAEVELLKE